MSDGGQGGNAAADAVSGERAFNGEAYITASYYAYADVESGERADNGEADVGSGEGTECFAFVGAHGESDV